MISTASDLIDALGGTGAVARMLEIRDNTVSTWRERGIPAWACATLRDACDKLDEEYDDALFAIRPRARRVA